MKKRLISLLLALSLALGSAIALVSCDKGENEKESNDPKPNETVAETEAVVPETDPGDLETNPGDVETEPDDPETDPATDPETDPETDPDEDETDPDEGETECFHPYAATQEGHWKPACSVCGKKDGKIQDHQYEMREEDEGDLIVYSLRCTVCKYRAYEQEVPYEINSFYSAGELAYTDVSGTLTGNFAYDSGVGYASYSSDNGGSAWVIVLSNGEIEDPSGRYLVMKVRMPKSQSSFAATIESVGANGNVPMTFTGLKSGWATLIVDITKAVSTSQNADGTENKLGYQPDASGEYYLGDFRLSIKAGAGESFDLAYIMFCDTLEDAQNFTKDEKTVITYDDILNGGGITDSKQCVDENGNPIEHKYIINDDGTHTLKETCYQCGLAAVENEPHTFAQIFANGDYTYACGACGHLQFGANINRYTSPSEIATTAATYYKVTQNGLLVDEVGGFEYASFSGQGTTAQILFARNNSFSAAAEEAGAFDTGKGSIFIMKLRTTNPEVSFGIQIGTDGDGTNNFRFPTAVSTANEWAVYVVDFASVVPAYFAPDENGNYRVTQFYYHIGGTDFTASVTYDIAYTAFVDSWEEVDALVDDPTVINVSGANKGNIVKTEDKGCVGEHDYITKIDGGQYKVMCAACGSVLKEYNVSGADAFLPAEVLAGISEMNGTVDIELMYDENNNGYVHLDNMVHNGPSGGNWMGWNIISGSKIEAGRFMIIKVRIGENGLGQPYLKFYTGTDAGVKSEGQAVSVRVSEDGQWHTIVVDLYTRIGQPDTYMVANASGKFDLKALQIRPFSHAQTKAEADDWMDIEYIAFCDSLSDLSGIIAEDQYEWSVSPEESILRDTATGSDEELPEIEYDPFLPVVSSHKITETSVDNGDGTVTYRYTCSHCTDISITKVVPASLGLYVSSGDIAATAGIYYQISEHKLESDGALAYTRLIGNGATAQAIWYRSQLDCKHNTFTGENFLGKELNVGKAKYLIIKARSNTPAQKLAINVSTTGKSANTEVATSATPLEGSQGESYYDINGNKLAVGATYAIDYGYANVHIPLNAAEANGWAVYVVNLAEVLPEYYVADGNGNYVIDTFFLHLVNFASNTYIDVEYMMFLEDWEDIDAVVEESKVVEVIGMNGEFGIVDTVTGGCAEHNGIVEIVDGRYVSRCSICQTMFFDYGIQADKVGAFLPAESLLTGGNIVGAMDREYLVEDGVAFVRIDNMTTNGASNGNWAGITPIQTKEAANKGRYMVVKVRVGQNGLSQSLLEFYASTVDGALVSGSYVAVKVSEDNRWHTIVVDLAARVRDAATYYQPDADGNYYVRYFQIRPMSGAQPRAQADDYMDISYIAFFDNLEDIKDIVSEETYEWSTESSLSFVRNTSDSSCAQHSVVESVEGNTYSYFCMFCDKISVSKTIPESVTEYMSAGYIASGAAIYYNVNGANGVKSVIDIDGEPYALTKGTNGQASQILWVRNQADYTADSGIIADEKYYFSVGKADKLVIKARTNSQNQDLRIDISTTGKSGEGYVAPSEGEKEVYPKSQGYVGVTFPISKSESDDGWATYVVDLAAIIPDYYVDVDGEYVIDTFYLHMEGFEATETVEIAYIAFVEGGWAEIDELVEETEVYNITKNTGDYVIVNVAEESAK